MQSNNLRFTFISLNLFILIFFILLTSYAALNDDTYPIENIFRSFSGKNLNQQNLIVITAEEQNLLKAHKYFKDKLEILLNKYQLQILPSRKINILYEIKCNTKELLNQAELFLELKKLIKSVQNIDDIAYGYILKLEFDLSGDIFLDDNLSLDKVTRIITELIKTKNNLKANDLIFNSNISENNGYLKILLTKL